MKNIILATILTVFTVALLFLVAVYGFGFLQRGTADFRGETDQIEDTKADSDYRIAQYDHFYDACASVRSIEGKIKNLEEELEETDDSQRESILKTSVTASKNKRAELIESYNADARKEDTRGNFRASDLPYELDVNKEETSCEVY